MPTKVIVDCSTGEVQEIELTAEEIKAQVDAAAKTEADRKAQEVIDATKAKAKAELLKKLGITEAEAELLNA
jgi:hypothetical protein